MGKRSLRRAVSGGAIEVPTTDTTANDINIQTKIKAKKICPKCKPEALAPNKSIWIKNMLVLRRRDFRPIEWQPNRWQKHSTGHVYVFGENLFYTFRPSPFSHFFFLLFSYSFTLCVRSLHMFSVRCQHEIRCAMNKIRNLNGAHFVGFSNGYGIKDYCGRYYVPNVVLYERREQSIIGILNTIWSIVASEIHRNFCRTESSLLRCNRKLDSDLTSNVNFITKIVHR